MDVSKEYIAMCEKAVEIQEYRSGEFWEMGDWYVIRRNVDPVFYVASEHNSDSRTPSPHEIWLPRQDQLQEMMPDPRPMMLEELFHDWFEEYGCRWDWSWEQHWLAFVMKEKLNKTWHGEDWIPTAE